MHILRIQHLNVYASTCSTYGYVCSTYSTYEYIHTLHIQHITQPKNSKPEHAYSANSTYEYKYSTYSKYEHIYSTC